MSNILSSVFDETIVFSSLYHIGLSTKLSSTKDDFLEGGELSLNAIFNDSSTL